MNHTTKKFNERIQATKSRLLDVVDRQIESLAERTAAQPSPPLRVAQRQFANITGLWKFCDLSRCRRSRCCRGEPRDCLRIGLTLLPPQAFDHLLERSKTRVKREKRKRAASLGPSAVQ